MGRGFFSHFRTIFRSYKIRTACSFFAFCSHVLIYSPQTKELPTCYYQRNIFWLKPHLLLPILFCQLNKAMLRIPFFVCLFGLAGLLLSSVIGGFAIITNYLALFTSNQIQSNFLGLIYGPTLRGQLLKFSINYDICTKVALVGYIFLLVFALLNRKKIKLGEPKINILFTSLIPLSLCLSLHLHNYDLLLLLPGILLLFTYSLNKPLNYLRIFIISIVVLISLSPIYVYLHYSYVLQGGLINPFFWIILIFAIGAFIIEQQRENFTDKFVYINNNFRILYAHNHAFLYRENFPQSNPDRHLKKFAY